MELISKILHNGKQRFNYSYNFTDEKKKQKLGRS